MTLQNNLSHREAFDQLMIKLKGSIFLSAMLTQKCHDASLNKVAHENKDIKKDRLTAKQTEQIFNATLERYSAIFQRSSYQHMAVSHLLSSAIHTEALMAYELKRYMGYLEQKHVLRQELQPLFLQIQEHNEQITALFNVARRAHNLDVSGSIPYIMPYRSVYFSPFNEKLQAVLVSNRDYFQRWQDGVVAIIEEDTIEQLHQFCQHAVILYLDADELLDQNMQAQLSGSELTDSFKQRLDYANNISPYALGEHYLDYINRLLLKQNAILRALHTRLQQEQHEAACQSCHPLIEKSTAQLQNGLCNHFSWAPENFTTQSEPLALLKTLEAEIRQHSTTWAEHGRTKDSAGLLFQFAGTLQDSEHSQALKALQDS